MKYKEYYFYKVTPEKIKGLKNCTVHYTTINIFEILEMATIVKLNNITLKINKIIPPEPPKPPRTLCKDIPHYVAGVVSPSLYMRSVESFDKTKEEKEYFCELNKYKFKSMLFDLARRKISKEKYKSLRRIMRTKQSDILLKQNYLIAINYNNLYVQVGIIPPYFILKTFKLMLDNKTKTCYY